LTGAEYAGKSLLHGVAGGLGSLLAGDRFGHGFLAAGMSQAFSGPVGRLSSYDSVRVFIAATVGGTMSTLTGGKFANGALTGAFSEAFNANLHDDYGQQESDFELEDPFDASIKFYRETTGTGLEIDAEGNVKVTVVEFTGNSLLTRVHAGLEPDRLDVSVDVGFFPEVKFGPFSSLGVGAGVHLDYNLNPKAFVEGKSCLIQYCVRARGGASLNAMGRNTLKILAPRYERGLYGNLKVTNKFIDALAGFVP
jgi:hypothetical protein